MRQNRGRTFEGLIESMNPPVHTAELVEHHEVSVPIPPMYLDAALGRGAGGGCHTTSKQVEFARGAAWSACRREAAAWCEANGVEAEIDVFTAGGRADEEPRWGARWTVVIGRGSASQTYHIDTPAHDVPAVDRWVWSDRWRDWLATFTAMTGEAESQRRALADGIASGEVIDYRSARAQHALRARPEPDFSGMNG